MPHIWKSVWGLAEELVQGPLCKGINTHLLIYILPALFVSFLKCGTWLKYKWKLTFFFFFFFKKKKKKKNRLGSSAASSPISTNGGTSKDEDYRGGKRGGGTVDDSDNDKAKSVKMKRVNSKQKQSSSTGPMRTQVSIFKNSNQEK